MKIGIAILLLAGLLTAPIVRAQGTIQITFDGPPIVPPGAAGGFTNYEEGGISFVPIPHPPPGVPQFTRSGGGRTEFADDGTQYLLAGLGDSLMFSFIDGSSFNLMSVDLAEFSVTVTNTTVQFIGYRPDGSTTTTDFKTDGIIDGPGGAPDFQTFYFSKEWTGLSRVEVPTIGWSLDNLVVSVPEPGAGALSLVGGAALWLFTMRRPKMRRESRDSPICTNQSEAAWPWFAPKCYSKGTGVALAPDQQSLYFMVNFDTLIQTDLQGRLLEARGIPLPGHEWEDIEVQ